MTADMTTLDDTALLARARLRDESAFVLLVDRYNAAMVRIARSLIGDAHAAEDVVQETWLGVINGLDRFEGRSAFKTWLFAILGNVARSRRRRDARHVPFSSLITGYPGESSVEPERFFPEGHAYPGHWVSIPEDWESLPVERLLASETRACIRDAIASLPALQRSVIELRDIGGFSAVEVCNALHVSETNQRVLLHRARSKVRQALEKYLANNA